MIAEPSRTGSCRVLYPHAVRTPSEIARDERIGLAAAAGAAIIYGSAYPATAIALRSFTPLGVAGLASTIALPFVVGAAWAGVIARPSRAIANVASLLRLATLAGLGGIGFIVAVNVAVSLSGPTVTGFVAPLYAVAASLLAIPLLGEHLRPMTVGAFALALVGTALLAGVDPSSSSLQGIVMAVAAAVMFGLYMVLARRWGSHYALDGTSVTIANLIGRGPILLAVAFIFTPGGVLHADPGADSILALLSIAAGASSSANLLLMASVRRVPARRTSAALLLGPVSSAVLSALLLGDRLTPQGLVGAALILVGIAGASGLIPRRVARPAPA